MPFLILKNIDITTLDCDAIVNAANTNLMAGGGVCGAIFHKAGMARLSGACKELAPVKTGSSVITPGFDLKAKHIIHSVGPMYIDGKHNEEELLSSCYLTSLTLATEKHLKSIAFPLISSGIYGYPFIEAYKIAKETILSFLKKSDSDMTVILSLYGSLPIKKEMEIGIPISRPRTLMGRCCLAGIDPNGDDVKITTSEETFTALLFSFIDKSGMSDSEFYHRANMDRRLFSKLKDESHKPSKNTILSSAIALKLNMKDTEKLLNSAGYTLSDSLLFDCIIKHCLQKGEYDIYNINEILFHYNQPILG